MARQGKHVQRERVELVEGPHALQRGRDGNVGLLRAMAQKLVAAGLQHSLPALGGNTPYRHTMDTRWRDSANQISGKEAAGVAVGV